MNIKRKRKMKKIVFKSILNIIKKIKFYQISLWNIIIE